VSRVSDLTDDRPGVLVFPPLLFVICLACGVGAHLVCPDRLALPPWIRVLAIALAACTVAFAFWGERTMKAAGTNVRPDRPALVIVSGGPFALVRNPLYLSLIVLYSAIGVALASPAFLVFVAPMGLVLHFGVVRREERYLEAKFGDVYRAYKARVRRWI
jgi:protein-S-isoprenylcysteine O-methyltransferase Ste14